MWKFVRKVNILCVLCVYRFCKLCFRNSMLFMKILCESIIVNNKKNAHTSYKLYSTVVHLFTIISKMIPSLARFSFPYACVNTFICQSFAGKLGMNINKRFVWLSLQIADYRTYYKCIWYWALKWKDTVSMPHPANRWKKNTHETGTR